MNDLVDLVLNLLAIALLAVLVIFVVAIMLGWVVILAKVTILGWGYLSEFFIFLYNFFSSIPLGE